MQPACGALLLLSELCCPLNCRWRSSLHTIFFVAPRVEHHDNNRRTYEPHTSTQHHCPWIHPRSLHPFPPAKYQTSRTARHKAVTLRSNLNTCPSATRVWCACVCVSVCAAACLLFCVRAVQYIISLTSDRSIARATRIRLRSLGAIVLADRQRARIARNYTAR